MNPLTESEQQYNGDEVANLVQLNSRWNLDGFQPDHEAIDNNVILSDIAATKHYPAKEVDTHQFIQDMGKWQVETNEAAQRVQ
jgi:hypothetical protein